MSLIVSLLLIQVILTLYDAVIYSISVMIDGEQHYRVGVTSRSIVPPFLPELPYPPLFKKDEKLRNFLYTKRKIVSFIY